MNLARIVATIRTERTERTELTENSIHQPDVAPAKRARKKATTAIREITPQSTRAEIAPLINPQQLLADIKPPWKVVKIPGDDVLVQGIVVIKCPRGHLHRYRLLDVAKATGRTPTCKTCKWLDGEFTQERQLLEVAGKEFPGVFCVYDPADKLAFTVHGWVAGAKSKTTFTIYSTAKIFIHLITDVPLFVPTGRLNINIKRKNMRAESEFSLMPRIHFTGCNLPAVESDHSIIN